VYMGAARIHMLHTRGAVTIHLFYRLVDQLGVCARIPAAQLLPVVNLRGNGGEAHHDYYSIPIHHQQVTHG
jgi:hypothetical protein